MCLSNTYLIISHLKNREMVRGQKIKDSELTADKSAVALSELWREKKA